MIIDAISDLHGFFPDLKGGDLLIVAGDLTASDANAQYLLFMEWLDAQEYKQKIVVAGNHDNLLFEEKFKISLPEYYSQGERIIYLCDSGTEFEGPKIWGSPWTPLFRGVNRRCAAFMLPEAELEAKFALIPDDVDILVTHGPPYGILDAVRKYGPFSHEREECVGSESLLKRVFDIRPQLHIFGHIHEGYGEYHHTPRDGASCELGITPIKFINCSHVNERYEPVNKPIRVIL